MKLYEYEGKAFLARYGIAVPSGVLRRAGELPPSDGYPAMVKAQVLSGGRGKAGGVRAARDAAEARGLVDELLGHEFQGERPMATLIEERLDLVGEFYLAITVDRVSRRPVILFSDRGGVEIEQQAGGRLVRASINPLIGPRPYISRTLVGALGLNQALASKLWGVLEPLYHLFDDLGCELAEINPLGLTTDGRLVALDAKLDLDEKTAATHPELADLDRFGGTVWERRAAAYGMSASELGGEITVVTGGAGITMATGDLILAGGGTLAAVVDLQNAVQGRRERALEVMSILRGGPGSVTFFNFYTQVAHLDLMAEAIVTGLADRGERVVTRLNGNRAAEGRQLMRERGFAVYEMLEEACSAAIELARSRRR